MCNSHKLQTSVILIFYVCFVPDKVLCQIKRVDKAIEHPQKKDWQINNKIKS